MKAKIRQRVARPAVLTTVLLAVLGFALAGGASNGPKAPGEAAALPPPSNGAISPQMQADAVHFVIAADRELLCQTGLAGTASPCALLRRAAESIQTQGAEFSYALRSLEPIDPRNGPQTDLEREGLAFIASHPAQNHHGNETLGGRRYFTAVYPDLPATAACIDCHDRRAGAKIRRYRAGEPMGGIVVRVPLEF
jgi:hypothetical protein